MTEPRPELSRINLIPERCQPWTVSGCTYPIATGKWCRSEDTVTLSHVGRRCAEHPPTFDPTVAVELVRDGWPDTAFAYIRAAS